MLETNFWQDKNNSQKVIKEKKTQEDLINSYNYSIKKCNEIDELFNLALDENNEAVIKDSLKSIEELKQELEDELMTFSSREEECDIKYGNNIIIEMNQLRNDYNCLQRENKKLLGRISEFGNLQHVGEVAITESDIDWKNINSRN